MSLSPTAHRLAAAVVTALTLAACSQTRPLSTQAAGHAITARIAGDHTLVKAHADGALLGSEFGSVTIERTRLRIEGANWVKIAEAVPVSLTIQRGHIHLTAGHVTLAQTVRE